VEASTQKYAASVAKACGRNLDAVLKDFRQDTWLNPLESMFYGSKGLLDGILVGPGKVVTRNEVLDYLKTDPEVQSYLTEKFGAKNNVDKYLKDRIRKLREPNKVHDPIAWEAANGRDPFDNPLKTVMLAGAQAKPIAETSLKGSAPRPQKVIDQFIIGRKPMLISGFDDDDDSEASMKAFAKTGWEKFIPSHALPSKA
jgi:hypothetical protein